MSFLSEKVRDRLWIFGTSALIAAFLLATYQSIIYAANLDAQDRQQDKVQAAKTAEWNTIEVVVKDTIEKAGKKLDEEVIPSILTDVQQAYTDVEKLRTDLEKIGDPSHDSPLINLLARNIENNYMYDINSDSNDIFILTKKDGIISDLSISTSSTTSRTIESEINRHYNQELAQQAFNAITNQAKRVDQPIIFWQFYNPVNPGEQKIPLMSFANLKQAFDSSPSGLSMLSSYEFLVPRYIFFDQDLLGNRLVDDRGIRQDIYQIVLVQGFNITEIINQSELLDSIYTGINASHSDLFMGFITIGRIHMILLFIGVFTIAVWLQFAVKTRRKYVDDDLNVTLPTRT